MSLRPVTVFAALLWLGASVSGGIAGGQKQNLGLITSSTSRPANSKDHQNYCENFADEAQEAQFAWRLAKINELEAGIAKRMDRLEKTKAELESWMTKRQAFLNRAKSSLVEIYTRMRPDAAASQLSVLDNLTAAAILMKLEPRAASLILGEIEPKKAAQLTTVMVGAARTVQAGG